MMADNHSSAASTESKKQGLPIRLHCGEGVLLRDGWQQIIPHQEFEDFKTIKQLKLWACQQFNARKGQGGARVVSDDYVLACWRAQKKSWIVLHDDHSPGKYVPGIRDSKEAEIPLLLAPKRSKKYALLESESREFVRVNSDAIEKSLSVAEENATYRAGDVIDADLSILESGNSKSVLQEALAAKPVLTRLDFNASSRSSLLSVVERVTTQKHRQSKLLETPMSPPVNVKRLTAEEEKEDELVRGADPDGLVHTNPVVEEGEDEEKQEELSFSPPNIYALNGNQPTQDIFASSSSSSSSSVVVVTDSKHTTPDEAKPPPAQQEQQPSSSSSSAQQQQDAKSQPTTTTTTATTTTAEHADTDEKHTLKYIFEHVAKDELKAYLEQLPPSVLQSLDNEVSNVAKEVVAHYKAWNVEEGVPLILKAVPVLLILRGPNYPMVQKLIQMKSEMRSGKHVRFSLSASQAKRERSQGKGGGRRLRMRRSSATPYFDQVRPTMALSISPEEMRQVMRRTSFRDRGDFKSMLPFDPSDPASLIDPDYEPQCEHNNNSNTTSSSSPGLPHANSTPPAPTSGGNSRENRSLTVPVGKHGPVRRSILKIQPSSLKTLHFTSYAALYKIWAKDMEYGTAMVKVKNGVCTRRWFSVNSDLTMLRWRKCSQSEEKKQKKSFTFRGGRSRSLANVRGMYYGTHYSTAFASYLADGGSPWLCFTIEFTESEANMHIICPDVTQVNRWFLGLQHLIHLTNTYVSRGTFLWQRTIMKFNKYGVETIRNAVETNTPLQ